MASKLCFLLICAKLGSRTSKYSFFENVNFVTYRKLPFSTDCATFIPRHFEQLPVKGDKVFEFDFLIYPAERSLADAELLKFLDSWPNSVLIALVPTDKLNKFIEKVKTGTCPFRIYIFQRPTTNIFWRIILLLLMILLILNVSMIPSKADIKSRLQSFDYNLLSRNDWNGFFQNYLHVEMANPPMRLEEEEEDRINSEDLILGNDDEEVIEEEEAAELAKEEAVQVQEEEAPVELPEIAIKKLEQITESVKSVVSDTSKRTFHISRWFWKWLSRVPEQSQ